MLKFIFKAVKFLKIQKFLFFILKTYGKFFPNNKVSRGGIKYELDLTKLIDISIFFGGWEKTTIQFLKANVKENDIVIEVGQILALIPCLLDPWLETGAQLSPLNQLNLL